MYMSPTELRAIAYGAGSFIPFESIDVMGDTLLESLSSSTSHQDGDALALLLRMMAVRATVARIVARPPVHAAGCALCARAVLIIAAVQRYHTWGRGMVAFLERKPSASLSGVFNLISQLSLCWIASQMSFSEIHCSPSAEVVAHVEATAPTGL